MGDDRPLSSPPHPYQEAPSSATAPEAGENNKTSQVAYPERVLPSGIKSTEIAKSPPAGTEVSIDVNGLNPDNAGVSNQPEPSDNAGQENQLTAGKTTQGNNQWEARQLNDVLKIYNVAQQIQRYEGSGIWSRFNIIVSLHAVLFGAVAFTYSSQPPNGRILVIIFSIGGCLLSLWALYVLHRLWMWHTHWKDKMHDIESGFPGGLPRLFADRPRQLMKSRRWYQSWLLAYTQPFLITLFLVWFSIALLAAITKGFAKVQTERAADIANVEQTPAATPTPQSTVTPKADSETSRPTSVGER